MIYFTILAYLANAGIVLFFGYITVRAIREETRSFNEEHLIKVAAFALWVAVALAALFV